MKIKNVNTVLFTLLLIWLPTIIATFFYSRLPEQIPTHFDINWNPDAYSSKNSFLLMFPLILSVVHLVCVLVTNADPKIKNIPKKVLLCLYAVCPCISIFVSLVTYSKVLGYNVNYNFISSIAIGVLFLVSGRFLLPKTKQNYSFGIKTPWTLNDEEIWEKTHIFGGKCFVAAGILMLASMFLDNPDIVIFVAIIIAVGLPFVYSYILYSKKYKN